MILADVGNSAAKVLINGEISRFSASEFANFRSDEKIFFISVNSKFHPNLPNFVDLAKFIEFDTNYVGLGIDRAVACMSVQNGVIIDAGSAITVDKMANGKHQGGFIYPGISAFKNAFLQISPVLKMSKNQNINLNEIPQNTNDALIFGMLQPIILAISEFGSGEELHFTGGNGEFLSRFFPNSGFNERLIFDSMREIIEKKGLL